MTTGKRVAVLGLGIVGMAIAKNLCAAGFSVSGWNRRHETALPLRSHGARVVDSPAAAVSQAEVVITMVSDEAAVQATIEQGGLLDVMAEDAVWIQMSTVGVAATERLRERAAAAGVAFVDAPVLGTRQPAEQGQLVILASGAPELQKLCAPVFAAIGACTLWLGAAGAGTRLKLLANQWSTGMVDSSAVITALQGGAT